MMLFIKLFLAVIYCFILISCGKTNTALTDMNGHRIPLSTLQGNWVFINYWASWCEPCVNEIPELNRFYENNKNNHVAVFAFNYDALPFDQQHALIEQYKIRYPSLKQDPAILLGFADVIGVPVTFVLNPQGKLSKTLYGAQTVTSLNKALK